MSDPDADSSQRECLHERSAADYAAGTLDDVARARLEEHMLGCAACRTALAACVRFVAAVDVDPSIEGLDQAEIARLDSVTYTRARALFPRRSAAPPHCS